MKKLALALIASAIFTSACASNAPQYNQAPINTVFGQGEINPYGKFFTGTSYLNPLIDMDDVVNHP